MTVRQLQIACLSILVLEHSLLLNVDSTCYFQFSYIYKQLLLFATGPIHHLLLLIGQYIIQFPVNQEIKTYSTLI